MRAHACANYRGGSRGFSRRTCTRRTSGPSAPPTGPAILASVKPLRVLLFDVFGTVVDWRSSLIDLASAAGERCGVPAAGTR